MAVTVALYHQGNTGNQICYLGKDLMVNLNVRLGDFVKIQSNGRATCICCAWLGKDVASTTAQYSDTVCSNNRRDAQAFSGNCRISRLHPVRCEFLEVTVIVGNLSLAQEYRNSSRSHNSLRKYCSNCLERLCVAKSYVVNCLNMRIGKLYGISHILVDNAAAKADNDCEYYIVTKNTTIGINSVHSREWFDQTCNRKTLNKLGGLQKEIQLLQELVQLPLEKGEKFKELGIAPPHGILLRGPPGCGKTSLVHHVSGLCGACLIVVNGAELFASHPGETEENLKRLFDKAALLSEEGACILFVDEIDSLCSKRGKSGKAQESRVTGQFMSLLDGLSMHPKVLVIGATNRPSALDPGLRRPGRFDREVMIGAPSLQQRKDILATQVSSLPVESDLDLDMLAGVTNGYVGADLAALSHEAVYLAMAEAKNDPLGPARKIKESHFVKALHKVRPSLQKGSEGLVDLRPVHWSDIGGLDEVKTQIKQAVEWPVRHPEAFQRMGLTPPKGVLLYGPPGCCKTTLVRAAATACHATFLAISGAQLYSPYVGDSERLIAEVFQKARACGPAIILLDEIDSIVGKRSESARSGVQERVLSALLNEMDGIGVRIDDGAASSGQQKLLEGAGFDKQEHLLTRQSEVDNSFVMVVAATNRPDLLDEALVRPGRIDRVIYVPNPDVKARKQILSIYSQKFNLPDCALDNIAEKTDMYTGADLENLCREAALFALTEDLSTDTVTEEHMLAAMKSVSPSLTTRLIQQYSNVNMSTFKNKNI